MGRKNQRARQVVFNTTWRAFFIDFLGFLGYKYRRVIFILIGEDGANLRQGFGWQEVVMVIEILFCV